MQTPSPTSPAVLIRRFQPDRVTVLKAVAMVAVIVLFASLGFILAQGQQDARASLQERFHARLDLTARFITAYSGDLLARQADVASRRLAARAPTATEFELVVADFGFEAAVLLDAEGRVLQGYPARPDLIGTVLSDRYAHLASAVRGQAAVSGVVPSAAKGIPIVAFAAPFPTTWGRRVLSGAFDVTKTPISAHLQNALPYAGDVYLVDQGLSVAASNAESRGVPLSLRDEDAALAAANTEFGPYERRGEARWFTTAPVDGTSLRLLASAPLDSLYAPIRGTAEWLPWLMSVALAASSLFTVHVLFALHRSRDKITVVAGLDPLTGALNRRALSAQAERLLNVATGARPRFSVLMIDFDRFKSINDTMGHDAGDEVLRVATNRMRSAVRPTDFVGRWGGEEFVVLLPGASLTEATMVAERVRLSISSTPIMIDAQHEVVVTASVGCTVWNEEAIPALIDRADQAMYRAKASGGNKVEATLLPA